MPLVAFRYTVMLPIASTSTLAPLPTVMVERGVVLVTSSSSEVSLMMCFVAPQSTIMSEVLAPSYSVCFELIM